MMRTALLIAASAAIASAQFTINSNGSITCYGNINGDYCAGESLATNIIIRCTNGIGQAGNCDDNLAGYYPYGVNFSPCWQSNDTAGDAACSKNCIVEGGSGNSGGTFTLPNCTPTPSTTSSSASSTSTSATTITSTYTSICTTAGTTETLTFTTTYCPESTSTPPTTTSSTITSTYTSICTTAGTTETLTFTTTYCPESTPSTSIIYTPTRGSSYHVGNSTTTVGPTGGSGGSSASSSSASTSGSAKGSSSATAIPVGPTTTSAGGSPPAYTGAAVANSVGAGLAGIGLVIAYFL